MRVLGHTGQPARQAFPDPGQTLLLRAALGEPDVARAAWDQWYRETDIEALDFDAHRMFPLLYRNLVALGIDCPDLPRLKGVYRHYWYGNQLLLADARTALQALRDAGIDTMVLKGLALTVAYYRDGGTRPMEDVDLLVRRDDAPGALRILQELGYVRPNRLPFERELSTRHATPVRNGSDRALDLHWYALFQSANDEDLWADSLPVEIAGVQTRVMCPSDQLLHVCVHSYWAPMRWLADAAIVIRTRGDAFDWDHLVDRAIARGCSVALVDALVALEHQLAVGVPASVISRLRAAPASRAERLAHRATVRPFAHGNLYAWEWDRYRRLRAARAPGVQPNFAAYMRDSRNLDGYRDLVRLLARKAVQIARYGVSEPGDP